MNFVDSYRIKRLMKKVGKYDADDILGLFGVERKSVAGDLVADLGFFGLGCFCGALAGMVFAPKPGIELRKSLRTAVEGAIGESKPKWQGMKETIKSEVEHRV